MGRIAFVQVCSFSKSAPISCSGWPVTCAVSSRSQLATLPGAEKPSVFAKRRSIRGREHGIRAQSVCMPGSTNVRANLPSTPNRGRESRLRTAVLVSGGGRSLENLCERISTNELTGVQICVVIASKKTAGAVQRAERFNIPVRVVRMKDHAGDSGRFSDAVTAVLVEHNVDLVVLAGWMHFYQIPDTFAGKVINIHPSLIPAFCGKGYYGHLVHEAVVSSGAL